MRKKLILFLMLALLGSTNFLRADGTQTYDFETGNKMGWTSIDADGDGFGWVMATDLFTSSSIGHNGSTNCVCSQSYDNPSGTALTPNNYLVSPVKAEFTQISFWACGQDALYAAEHFGVAVSTTTATAADFTTIQEWTLAAKGSGVKGPGRNGTTRDQGTYYQFTADLSAYAGQEIWVAIRHFNCTDMFVLNVDDITVQYTGELPEPPAPTVAGTDAGLYDFEDESLADFTNGDSYPWAVVTPAYEGYNGSKAMSSSNAGHSSSTSAIEIMWEYTEDGFISFLGGCWGEGTGTNIWDKCLFYIDGVEQMRKGAVASWKTYKFDVPAGVHTFKWAYSKDSSVNPTGDCFYVDDVTFGLNSQIVDLGEIVEIGDGTDENYTLPINMYYRYSCNQQIFTADEIGNVTSINSIGFYYNYTAAFSVSDVKMYMKKVSRTQFESNADYEPLTAADLVWTGDLEADGPGWVTLILDAPFEFDGTGNLLVALFDDTYAYCPTTDKFLTTPTTENMALSYYSDSYTPDPYNLGSYSGNKNVYQYRNNVQLGVTPNYNNYTGTITIGEGELTDRVLPVNAYYRYTFSEMIYSPTDIGATGKITSFGFHHAAGTGFDRDVTVYMKQVSRTDFAGDNSWEPLTEEDIVYQGQMTSSSDEWITFELLDPFVYDGTSSLLFAFDDNTGSYIFSGYNFYYTETSANTCKYYSSDSNNPDPYEPPTGSLSKNRPDLQLTFDSHAGVWEPNYDLPMDVDDIVIVSPAIGTINVTDPVILEWDNATNAAEYMIEFGTVYGHLEPLLEDWAVVVRQRSSLDLGELGITLQPNVRYYWKVYNRNNVDEKNALGVFVSEMTTAANVRVEPDEIFTDETTVVKWTIVGNGMDVFPETTLGSGTATNDELPSNSYYKYGYSQQIYTGAEIGGAGFINSISFYNAGSEEKRLCNVYLVTTDKTSFNDTIDWIPVSQEDLVYSDTIDYVPNAWTTISFEYPYIFDGTNLAVIVDDNTGAWERGLSCRAYEAQNQALYVRSDNTNYDPFDTTVYVGTRAASKNQIMINKGGATRDMRNLLGCDVYVDGVLVNADGPVTGYEYTLSNLHYNMEGRGHYVNIVGVHELGKSEFSDTAWVRVSGYTTVTGSVKELMNGEIVTGATVQLEGKDEFENPQSYQTVTDTLGNYEIDSVKVGRYTVTAILANHDDAVYQDTLVPFGTPSVFNFFMHEVYAPVYKVYAVEESVLGNTVADVLWSFNDFADPGRRFAHIPFDEATFSSVKVNAASTKAITDFDGENWYYYDDGVCTNQIGTNSGAQFYWAVKFPAGNYTGNQLSKVAVYDGQYPMEGYVIICNEAVPDEIVGLAPVTFTGADQFVEVDFDEPVEIDPSQDVWVILFNASGSTFPAAGSADCGDPNARWISFDAAEWVDVASYGINCSWMIRAYIEEGEGGSNGGSQLATDDHYFMVYRMPILLDTMASPDNIEPTLLAEVYGLNFSDTLYSDHEWTSLDRGVYKYGVSAVYPWMSRSDNNVTPITWSNKLDNNMITTLVINPSINTGSIEGAVLSLNNVNEDVAYNIEFTDANVITNNEFRRGNYELIGGLDGYKVFVNDIEITNDTVPFDLWNDNTILTVRFVEDLTPITNLYVSHTGFARWNDVLPHDRVAEHYHVMCDDIFQGETEDNYMVLNTEGFIDGETYTAQVAVVYSTGFSSFVQADFVYYSCDSVANSITELAATVEEADVNLTWVPVGEGSPCLNGGGSGENGFTEDFEGGLNGWTVLTVNADGGEWVHSDDNPGGYNYTSYAHSGTGFAMCYSYVDYVGAFNTDSYLVSPEKYAIVAGSTLTFYADNANDSYAEPFSVCVATADAPTASDFTTVWSGSAKGNNDKVMNRRTNNRYGNWRLHTIDLSAYAGQSVYIAFHDVNEDAYECWIDDVTLSAGAKGHQLFASGKVGGIPANFAFTDDGNWYYYDDGAYDNAIGAGGDPFYWAVMFPAGTYEGNQVTKVAIYAYQALNGTVTIYNDGTTAPANAVGSTTLALTAANDFVEVEFPTPVTIDPTKNVWVVVYYSSGGQYPAAASADTGDPNGRWVSLDGTTWEDLGSYGLDQTFMVRAYITDGQGGGSMETIYTPGAFHIFRDGELVGVTTENAFTYTSEDDDEHEYTVLYVDENYNFSCAASIVVAANELGQFNIVSAIYPNPTSGDLFITTAANMKNITIVNVLGQVVYDKDTEGTETRVDMAKLGNGIYMVNIVTENGTSTHRIIVNK